MTWLERNIAIFWGSLKATSKNCCSCGHLWGLSSTGSKQEQSGIVDVAGGAKGDALKNQIEPATMPVSSGGPSRVEKDAEVTDNHYPSGPLGLACRSAPRWICVLCLQLANLRGELV